MQRCTWCTSCSSSSSSCTEIEKPRKRTCATSCGVSWNKDVLPKRIIPYGSHHCHHLLEKWRHIEEISTRPRHLHFEITLFNKQTPDGWGEVMGSASTTPLWPFSHSRKTSTSTWAHPKDKKEEKDHQASRLSWFQSSSTMVFITAFPGLQRQTVASKPPCKEHEEQRILRTLKFMWKRGVSSIRIIALIRASSIQTIFIMLCDCHAKYCRNAQVTGFFAESRALALLTLVCLLLLVLSSTEI